MVELTVILEPRDVKLNTRTNISVSRILPHRRVRTIGAWCFVDHFGPTDQTQSMVVAKHPHTGLQTVTWLLDGKVEHRDSAGSLQHLEPGQLGLMTAGAGITHSELSLETSGMLHAVQLWVALPDEFRGRPAFFEHHSANPRVIIGGLVATVFMGEFAGVSSPAKVFSPLLGAELRAEAGSYTLALDPGFEHGLLLISGNASVAETVIAQGSMLYLEPGQETLELKLEADSLLLLIGGEPFEEQLVMWWNFIGRSHAEIREMREAWNTSDARSGQVSDQFGNFEDRIGGWIPAPEMPSVNLRPR